MASVNHVQLIGYLTEDVDVRNLSSGMTVTDLNVQVKSRFTKDDGSDGIATSFHTVTVWGQSATFLGQYARKGSQVYVSGRLKTDSWEDDQGNKKYKTKVVADMFRGVELLDPKTPLSPLTEQYAVAGGLNRVDVLGNITKDLELKETAGGNKVVNFSLATNRRWKDKETDEMKEESEFHNIVAWGNLAQDAAQIIKKGQAVFVSGALNRRSWETPDGEKRYATEINADQILALGHTAADLAPGRDNTEAAPATASKKEQPPRNEGEGEMPTINYESEIKPEDLPF